MFVVSSMATVLSFHIADHNTMVDGIDELCRQKMKHAMDTVMQTNQDLANGNISVETMKLLSENMAFYLQMLKNTKIDCKDLNINSLIEDGKKQLHYFSGIRDAVACAVELCRPLCGNHTFKLINILGLCNY